MENIVGKISVFMCVCTTDIIAFVTAFFHKFLKFRHNQIVASVALVILAQTVVNLFSAVKAQNNVVHLAVAEINHVIIDQNAVCGKREAEIFACLLYTSITAVMNEPYFIGTPRTVSTSDEKSIFVKSPKTGDTISLTSEFTIL